jgi:2-amino-4-hydroxy-6-hydroxymethyldihydropteridine diphosphokinase
MQTCTAIEGFERVMAHDFVVGLGSNLGERGDFLAHAVTRLAALPQLRLTALSRVFESDAHGPPQPRYLNAAARLTCDYRAEELLQQLLAIEAALGRTRVVRWGPRVLDLDILWGREAVRSAHLTVPHARLRERAFALAPLLDVAPDLAVDYADALCRLGGAPAIRGRLLFGTGAEACEYIADGIV